MVKSPSTELDYSSPLSTKANLTGTDAVISQLLFVFTSHTVTVSARINLVVP